MKSLIMICFLLRVIPYPLMTLSGSNEPRVIDRFGDISKDEEQELVAYLAFLRARKGRKE